MTPHLNQININELSFEEILQQLETIVLKLEDGRLPLEQAVQYYEEGAILKEQGNKLLKSARLKIHEIMIVQNSDISVKPSSLQDLVPE